MAQRRTVDLLPEIFRTDTNKKFLSATLDQLTQEPVFNRTQGYVGRRVGPGVNPSDSYVVESSAVRTDYQLEPGVVFYRPDTNTVEDAITYPGMIDALDLQGAQTARQDRLWESQYYSWDPFCDLDKFVNYSQYYWLPQGPDSVDISTTEVALTDEWTVSRTSTFDEHHYRFSDLAGNNPVITLVRGGNYTFDVNQTGHQFWIQTVPGINGRLPQSPNISSRDVLGVDNNGEDSGTITFNVPLKSAQDFYYSLADIGTVDLVSTNIQFIDINNVYVDQFLTAYPDGVDGITNLDGRTIVFTSTNTDAEAGGWQITTQFDPLPNAGNVVSGSGSFDSTLYDQIQDLDKSQRYSIWQIQYIYDGGSRPYMRLTAVSTVDDLSRFRIQFGTQWSNTQWYKNASGFFEQVPLLTAVLDTLYYQDGTDPEIFGRIQLIDPAQNQPLDLDDIIGAKNYTSPNGVVFTNGMKVQLRGLVNPPQFQNLEFYVEGVGTGLGIEARVGFINGEAYFGPWHADNGLKYTGAVHNEDEFQQRIFDTYQDSVANPNAGGPAGAALPNTSIPGATVGNGIVLLPVTDFVTPETYTRSATVPYDSTPYDSQPYDSSLNAPDVPDYLTINRAARDRNAWSRSNRWFHIDVINATATYNNQVAVLDNDRRAKRPIVEFRAGLELFQFGTQGKQPVDIIDFQETDAFSNINGQLGYSVDGYQFINGTRVIFAADQDAQVRNRVYQVEFIDPDGSSATQPIINLVEVPDSAALINQTVVSLNGLTLQGKSFYFDGSGWISAQQKTSVNQAPLFNVRDANGVSYSDLSVYPSTTFAGTRLFGYAIGGTDQVDDVLGFALRYLNINNIGDILFENYLYTDTFIYVRNSVSSLTNVSDGFVRQYFDRTGFSNLIGWQTAAAENRSRQVFQFTYAGTPLVFDVPAAADTEYPPLQIFIEGEFIDPTSYAVSVTDAQTIVAFTDDIVVGSIIEAQIISDQASTVAFYQVPLNLENNPLNENSDRFTLGTIRNHYNTIGQNLRNLQGPVNGANNIRDLGDVVPYGDLIVQNSAPAALTGVFLRKTQYELFDSLRFNSQEYEKFKAILLDLASNGDFVNLTPTQVLDSVLVDIASGKNDLSPFYWSDMIPSGETYTEVVSTYTPISQPVFDLNQTYDFTSSNFQGLLIYVNGTLLTRGYDYVVSEDSPTVTVTVTLSVGDVITIREYATTYGSFVPNTPTKLGLYAAYRPQIYLDTATINPVLVIQGHDGSITRAFGDFRDQVLLEFETRIYNNLKIASPVPLTQDEVVPGQFRTTDYTLSEINEILAPDFLSWVAWNKLDYTSQSYLANDAFTYNYSQSGDKLDGEPLLGAWRGIYNYFYDTTDPSRRPWEMLGFSEQPSWWQNEYGPAPYTSGNWVLWEDLAAGRVKDSAGYYTLPQYQRPGLITDAVTSIVMQSGGTGYTAGDITILVSPDPEGEYAQPVVLGDPVLGPDGSIQSIPILSAGRGYRIAPSVTIRSDSGTGALAFAQLTTVPLTIPVDSEGQLLPPLRSVVGNYDGTSFRRSWTFGDDGPVENAWRTSSAYPFAVMRLLALTKPAKFFSLFADRDRYVFDSGLDQYLWDGRYRLDGKDMAPLYGNGVSKASYINWIIDYNRQTGQDSTDSLLTTLDNIGVQLCWRLGAFTDKKYLKIFAERSAPASQNVSLQIPDESYQLLVYKNQPFGRIKYSSVIVQRVDTGWAVLGYSQTQPYFTVQVSRPSGVSSVIDVGGSRVRVLMEYYDRTVQIPYNYVFTNETAVCDFLLSYGEYLRRQGLTFEQRENGYILDWMQMAQEFLYWSQQGWGTGSMINLNPAALKITTARPQAVVDDMSIPSVDNLILNQNRLAINPADLVINRIDNTFSVTTAAQNQTISFVNLKFTAYEHLVILDNVSIFSDLIYQPVTAARQNRVLVSGWLSGDWTGLVNAPGFVLNQNNIRQWQPNTKYTKGEIVLFKNEYWSAATVIQPSEQFDYSVWLRSDYDEIQRGLLPNAANASDQLAQSYSVYDANLEQEIDLFSYGLIGFRPRQYMQALNLDDVSQVGLYQQFLGSKGTTRSTEIFSYADLGKETAQYKIYEYWAMLRSQYGATANRSYIELLLDQSKLVSDPATLQIINPGEASEADQTVMVENIWKSSYKINSPDIFPTTLTPVTDTGLPSAGYASLDDVDITVFDLDAPQSLVENLNSVEVGTTIWVAKVNDYDWNIYRAESIVPAIVSVSDNLNARARVQFNNQHGLTVGDILLIRFFDPAIDGVYRVRAVPSLSSVLIDYVFLGGPTAVTGDGIGFRLQSSRVQQPSDIVDLPYAKQLEAGARVWVDNSGRGTWTVLEKTDPFLELSSLRPLNFSDSQRFGSSAAQGFRNLSAMIGAPGYDQGTGGIYTYVRESNDRYVQDSDFPLQINAANVAAFGSAVEIGQDTWAVAGAPGSYSDEGYALTIFRPETSGTFERRQLLVSPDEDFGSAEFGYAVTISQDERWMYIGAPGRNKVYTFGRVDMQLQTVSYITVAGTFVYNFEDVLGPLGNDQIVVLLDNNTLIFDQDATDGWPTNTSYSIDSGNIVLNAAPEPGQILIIARRVVYQLDVQNYYARGTSGGTPPATGATFTVNVVRGQYTPTLVDSGSNYTTGDVLTILGTDIGGASPANDLTITVGQTGPVYSTIVNSGVTLITISDTTGLASGQEIYNLVGSAGEFDTGTVIVDVLSATQFTVDLPTVAAGTVSFYVTPGSISSFTYSGSGDATTDVFDLTTDLATVTDSIFSFTLIVNGDFYRPFIDYTYASGTITFLTTPPLGATIIAETRTHWEPLEALTISGIGANARFGESVATSTDGQQVIIGAPFESATVDGDLYDRAGKSYVFRRKVERFQVLDTAQLSYTTVNPLVAPTAVTLNGVFLTDSAQFLDGQFTTAGNTVTLSSSVSLTLGDTLEIETNQFDLLQAFDSAAPGNAAGFGSATDLCSNNCSLFVGSPTNSTLLPQAGVAEFFINQSRVYGTITTGTANPDLSSNIGQYLVVNNVWVEIDPPTWSTLATWAVGDTVISSGALYLALRNVPTGVELTDRIYWRPTGWAQAVASLVNSANETSRLPNVSASVTADLEFVGDGSTRTYDVSALYTSAQDSALVFVDDELQTSGVEYTYSFSAGTVVFASAPAASSQVRIVGGRVVFVAKNPAAATPGNRLEILPGNLSVFEKLGLSTYVHQQTIQSPVPQVGANFGRQLVVDSTTSFLVISAPTGSTIETTSFDTYSDKLSSAQSVYGSQYVLDNASTRRARSTTFDGQSTNFVDAVTQSGAVYIYDYLPAASASITNPAQFVFGQQVYDADVRELDEFGTALNFTSGILLIGSPGNDPGDSTDIDLGRAVQFLNDGLLPAWRTVRSQQPVVDINLMNTVFMYDRVTGAAKQYFDYFDPLQGRILGAARQNIDFIGAVDPAAYNNGPVNNYGQRWQQERVGQIWWNTSRVRFVDPNQDDIVYASRRWGQVFPGSSVDVYQWIASDVPPIDYTGPGIPFSTSSYVVSTSVDLEGLVVTTYFFWVSGIRTVDQTAKKTLSIDTIARYIESPRSSGISYIAPINSSTVAVYNALEYISAEDTVLHVEFDQEYNQDAVHVEYQLIPQGRADGFLVESLYQKMLDSFAGTDLAGNPVPDPFLVPSEKYGVAVRPRQSLFRNRFLALQNYLTSANTVLAQYAIVENRSFSLLNSEEPVPSESSGAWDKRLDNDEQLTYQDLRQVPVGYRYLVLSDANNNGLWAIYEVTGSDATGARGLLLIRVQNYDTKQYWSYIDWYLPGYNSSLRPIAEVPTYSALDTITVPDGSSVKVLANAQGKFEIYRLTNGEWVRVGLEDGTIQFDPSLWNYQVGRFGFDVEVFDAQYFDKEPTIETRKIIEAINQELFIGDLLIERNRLLTLMFNFILQEQEAPTWLTKTSLIDVDHIIRDLEPFQIYRADNQDFVLDYIQEVKPYHVQIREFNLIYQGLDTYRGTVTDFDVPAFWSADESLFVSPVLDDNLGPAFSTTSSFPSSAPVWQQLPWNQWFQNYLLSLEGATVVDGGSAYTVPPDVVVGTEWQASTSYEAGQQIFWRNNLYTVTGAGTTGIVAPRFASGSAVNGSATLTWAGSPAKAVALISSAGAVASITVTDPGSGYSTTPAITLIGGNGQGARAAAVVGNNLVRSILTTIKYDRYEYQSNIVDWQSGVIYTQGTQVRYADRVWSSNATGSSTNFDPEQWTVVPAGDLSGVNRTQGYYTPAVNEIGLDLALLISGISYPGVQVFGLNFDQNTGFDVGNFDINPFDNISFGPEGRPTYDPALLDAIYESAFTDPYLGVLPAPAYNGAPPEDPRPSAIEVVGGEFVDTYSSHAPEELVPGAIFDTLDIRVLSTPGSDWNRDGHGFPIVSVSYEVVDTDDTYSFAGLTAFPFTLAVFNKTTGQQLILGNEYQVDWIDQSVTVAASTVSVGQVLGLVVYGLGGGNQLFQDSYNGTDVGDSVIIPVDIDLIFQMAIFVNGVQLVESEYSIEPYADSVPWALASEYAKNTVVENSGSYYRAIQEVPAGILLTNALYWTTYSATETRVLFDTTYTDTDFIALSALGLTDNTAPYSWSTPITEYFTSNGSLSYTIVSSVVGTNPANMIVEINGIRARPPEGIEYTADGSTVDFNLPTRGGYSQALVADNDVAVYLDSKPLTLGSDYTVSPWLGSGVRYVMFAEPPSINSRVLISVRTAAQYVIVGNTLTFKASGGFVPLLGDVVSVTTFNDTTQQNILTQVFAGPSSEGLTLTESYDSTTFDDGTLNFEPGAYDYTVGTLIQTNEFDTGRVITNAQRLTVTLNGRFLFNGQDFTTDGTKVILAGPVISAADIVAIESYAETVLPGAIAFRIFQDMRGQQTTYRILSSTTTQLSQAATATADVLYVEDASRLGVPDLPAGIFGVVTIGGERITYRTINTSNNTVSGLRRGTAGTAAAAHAAGAAVIDMGVGSALPIQYQDTVQVQNSLATGSQTVFVCEDISVDQLDSTELVEAVQVYVGGTLQTTGYTITGSDPVTITFDTAPLNGYQVSVRVRRGLSWYQPGAFTPSDGIALQDQTTLAARFIRGD